MTATIRLFSSSLRQIARFRRIGSLALAVMVAGSACSETSGPDEETIRMANVAGSWSGTISFSNQGRTASMDLQQRGRAISGQMSVAGAFRDALLNGDIDEFDRLAWVVTRGCEVWSGLLTVESNQVRMAGPVLIDGSRCPVVSSTDATLRLDRAVAQ